MNTPVFKFRKAVITGVTAFVFSSIPVWIGVSFGIEFIANPGRSKGKVDFETACCRYDGNHYADIVRNGYSFHRGRPSNVAFFPGFPLVAESIVFGCGCSAETALLVAANGTFIAALVVMAIYLTQRYPEMPQEQMHLVFAFIGIFPTGFFFRMAYSESLFLFGLALFLAGLSRHWPYVTLALICGAVTGIRPVGVACLPGLVWHIGSDQSKSSASRLRSIIIYTPIACWGVLAFMAYQQIEFNEPLASFQTQEHWRSHSPRYRDLEEKFWDKAAALLTAEPIINIYDPDSKDYFRRIPNAVFSLYFWNPIIFVGAAILIAVGWYQRWLSAPETIVAFFLLLIPYATKAFENSMLSHARFATVILPAYVVAARLLYALPSWATWAVVGNLSAILALWSALFAARQPMFY